MAHSSNFRYGEDSGYVDIHGDDIRVFVCEKTGQILVPINELKDKGFRIYRKNQYNRFLIDDSQFVHEFDMFLLASAQSYMLKNQINFKENEILESINKVKRRLTEGSSGVGQTPSGVGQTPTPNNTSNQFLKDHRIENSADEGNISITREVKKEPPQKYTLRSPHSANNNSHDFPRRSLDQMSDKSDDSRSSRNPRSRPFENKNFDLDQNKNRPNRSFENGYKTNQDNRRNFGEKTTNGYDPRPRNNFNQINPKREVVEDGEATREETRIATAELVKDKHEVLVVFVEKPGIMWVHDVENIDILTSITEKVAKEAECQKTATRIVANTVYLAQQDNEWFRCKAIRFRPVNVVFFLDYGNTEEVKENSCKETSNELASIPAQAIKVRYDENKYTAKEGDVVTVKVNGIVGKGTYSVDVCGKEELISPQSPEVVPSKSLKVTVPTYFDKPKPLCSLENGQRVMIINETNGRLALRTKECYVKLQQIENTIQGATLKVVEKMEKKQLILCKKDDGKLYRGQIVQIKGAMVEVELLDYCEKVQVAALNIKQINDALSLEPTTYFMSPTVKGFKELTEKGRNYIKGLIDDKAKASVILEGTDFDLQLADDRLSNKLRNLEKRSDMITLNDMEQYKPPLGEGLYGLYCLKDNGEVTLVSDTLLGLHVDTVIISEVECDDPYSPVLDEVCLGLYQDSWSRCAVTKVMTSRFEVKFIDFGNVENLNSTQLRKLPKDAAKTPILGVPCILVGLPAQKTVEILRKKFDDGESYDVIVKKFDARNNRFEIEVPQLYE